MNDLMTSGYISMISNQCDKLREENNQLKEDKIQLEAKLGEANDIIDIEMELRDFWIDKYHELRQVLNEIREYIKGWQDFSHTNESTHRELRNLMEILNKVKE